MFPCKVCHITTVHNALDIRIFHKECKTLTEVGYTVTLIAQHDEDAIIDDVNIIALPQPKNRLHRLFIVNAKAFVIALKQQAELYHIHDPELLLLGLMFKILKKKIIYDVHEDVSQDILTKLWIPSLLRTTLSQLFKLFEGFAAMTIGTVVTATPFIRDRFLRIGIRAIDVRNYPRKSEFVLAERRNQKREFSTCYIGLISEARGIFEMIRAVAQTEAVLFLAGQFSSLKERKTATAKPGWSSVIELGQIDREKVVEIMLSSVCGLVILHPISTFLNSLPIKMFEYMAAGIPVIASDFPLWKKIINCKKCGICVDPLDIKAIAKAIQWILEHPAEAEQMGMNGRKAVESEYNWESESKKLINLYSCCLE